MADDAASVTRTGISYHTKEELIAKITGGTVAEVKPYTHEELAYFKHSPVGCAPDPVNDIGRWLATLAAVEKELEQERVRLAGCGVVALADTPESAATQRAKPGDYGHSASMDDVARRVDECISLRIALAASQATVKELREALDRLARLGNEPHYGNSEGNCIAQAALARTDDMGALEAFAKVCVAAGRKEADDEQQAWSAGVPRAASSDEAIVARLMRRDAKGAESHE